MHRDAGGCITKKIFQVGGTIEKWLLLSQQFKSSTIFVLKLCKCHCSWHKISLGFHPTVSLAYLDYLKK